MSEQPSPEQADPLQPLWDEMGLPAIPTNQDGSTDWPAFARILLDMDRGLPSA